MHEVFATAFSGLKTEPSGQNVQQPSLDTNLRQSLDCGKRRHTDLSAAILNFVCEGLYPVSVVEEPTFKALMGTIDSNYSPPNKSELV